MSTGNEPAEQSNPTPAWHSIDTEGDKLGQVGFDSLTEAYMESEGKKETSLTALATVQGLCFVFAVQYLIDFELDVFASSDGALKAYLFFMSMSAGTSGSGMWICVCLMAFAGYLQAEYMQKGAMGRKQFEAYKKFSDGLFWARMVSCILTVSGVVTMCIGAFLYTGYKLEAGGKRWEFIAIAVVIPSFFMLITIVVSVIILMKYFKATGWSTTGTKE